LPILFEKVLSVSDDLSSIYLFIYFDKIQIHIKFVASSKSGFQWTLIFCRMIVVKKNIPPGKRDFTPNYASELVVAGVAV